MKIKVVQKGVYCKMAKGGSITLDESTANKKVTSSGTVILKNGSSIFGTVKATVELTLP